MGQEREDRGKRRFPTKRVGVFVLALAVGALELSPGPAPSRVAPQELAELSGVENPSAGTGFYRPAPTLSPKGLISFDDDRFEGIYRELYDHRTRYLGREVELRGTVRREEGLPEKGYLVGRRLRWCCENDEVFLAFVVLGGKAPPDGTGVRVRGRLVEVSTRDPESGKTFPVPAVRAHAVSPDEGFSPVVFPVP